MNTIFYFDRMIRFWVLFGVIFFFHFHVQAQIDQAPASGGRAVAMGKAYTGVGGDYWALFHNPAGIAGMDGAQAGVYLEQRFLLSELNFAQAGFATSFADNQAFGFSLSSFGFDAYQENSVGLVYGIEVLNRIRVGAGIKYGILNIQEQGNDGSLLVQVGIQTQVNSELSIGFSAYNVNRAQLDVQGVPEIIPSILRGGLAYSASDRVLLVFDLVKDVDHALSYRGGLEYEINEVLKARGGVGTEPLSFSLGLGIDWKEFQADFASSYTERLGYSPHLSISYRFGKSAK
ncbi:MAG: hypothetical protein R8P61_12760 [Bacteroidia bacterium]|nr:hypothetical protein [Bacteroidia bacterium]